MTDLPVNPRYAALGVENVVLSGTSARHAAVDSEGWLSIKGMVRGSAAWEAEGRRWAVNEDCCLILNDRQSYTLTIESTQPATTFCLFFARGFVEDVFRATVTATAALLDDPEPHRAPSLNFFEGLEPGRSRIAAATRELHRRIEGGGMTREGWESRFRSIALEMIERHHQASERAAKLPAAKVSTRLELYRRVLRGRDLLLSCSDVSVSLNAVAREACLSPFHFHRCFTRIFGATPHRYLTAYRMERAARLLACGSVTEVALESGFESTAAFSGAFRSHFGRPPSTFKSRN